MSKRWLSQGDPGWKRNKEPLESSRPTHLWPTITEFTPILEFGCNHVASLMEGEISRCEQVCVDMKSFWRHARL
ncbi:hypothetical protein BD309DRAFT_955904 [Dichomitus squalens]|nr:hypothetical protein BD309DRAFT_955904 [Dichomitus squalens]